MPLAAAATKHDFLLEVQEEHPEALGGHVCCSRKFGSITRTMKDVAGSFHAKSDCESTLRSLSRLASTRSVVLKRPPAQYCVSRAAPVLSYYIEEGKALRSRKLDTVVVAELLPLCIDRFFKR